MVIEIIPGKFTDPQMTKFNWTFVDYTTKELVIQLNFENLSYISAKNGYPDLIKLTIYGIQYFTDNLDNFMHPPTTLNQKALPPLTSKLAVSTAYAQAQTTQNTLLTFIVMALLSNSVQQVLSSFRHTQITVHLMLIAVNQPATVLIFFGGLMKIVNF